MLEILKHSSSNSRRSGLGVLLMSVSEELRGDREFMMEAVKQCGYSLKFASKDLKRYRELVVEALKPYGKSNPSMQLNILGYCFE